MGESLRSPASRESEWWAHVMACNPLLLLSFLYLLHLAHPPPSYRTLGDVKESQLLHADSFLVFVFGIDVSSLPVSLHISLPNPSSTTNRQTEHLQPPKAPPPRPPSHIHDLFAVFGTVALLLASVKPSVSHCHPKGRHYLVTRLHSPLSTCPTLTSASLHVPPSCHCLQYTTKVPHMAY